MTTPDDGPTATPPPGAMSFVAFVLSLAHRAAVHFGDVADPVSGQRGALNLSGAQQVIDILAMLDLKTRGNLTAEERQLLDQVLLELRMRHLRASAGTASPASPRPTGS